MPPPLTMLHVPPDGEPTNAFDEVSQISAVEVVLTAAPGSTFTIKVASAVVAAHDPFAAIVYLTVTDVFTVTFAGI